MTKPSFSTPHNGGGCPIRGTLDVPQPPLVGIGEFEAGAAAQARHQGSTPQPNDQPRNAVLVVRAAHAPEHRVAGYREQRTKHRARGTAGDYAAPGEEARCHILPIGGLRDFLGGQPPFLAEVGTEPRHGRSQGAAVSHAGHSSMLRFDAPAGWPGHPAGARNTLARELPRVPTSGGAAALPTFRRTPAKRSVGSTASA